MTFAIRFGSSVPAFQRVNFGMQDNPDEQNVVLSATDTETTVLKHFRKLEQGKITSLFVPTVQAKAPAYDHTTSPLHSTRPILGGTSSHLNTISLYASTLAHLSEQKDYITIDKEADVKGVKGTLYTYTKPA